MKKYSFTAISAFAFTFSFAAPAIGTVNNSGKGCTASNWKQKLQPTHGNVVILPGVSDFNTYSFTNNTIAATSEWFRTGQVGIGRRLIDVVTPNDNHTISINMGLDNNTVKH